MTGERVKNFGDLVGRWDEIIERWIRNFAWESHKKR